MPVLTNVIICRAKGDAVSVETTASVSPAAKTETHVSAVRAGSVAVMRPCAAPTRLAITAGYGRFCRQASLKGCVEGSLVPKTFVAIWAGAGLLRGETTTVSSPAVAVLRAHAKVSDEIGYVAPTRVA